MSRPRARRRAVLRAAALGALVSAGHLLLGQWPGRSRPGSLPGGGRVRLLRPPGALPEPEFLARCMRCTRCMEACSVGAIWRFTEAAGPHHQTPYVDPALRGCTLCMRCTLVCPTGALEPMQVEERSRAGMGSVSLSTELCLSHKAQRLRQEQAMLMELGQSPMEATAVVTRRGPCGECHMFCPLRGRAIKLEPGAFLAPEIFTDACVGCGMCEEICRVLLRGEPAIRVVSTRGHV